MERQASPETAGLVLWSPWSIVWIEVSLKPWLPQRHRTTAVSNRLECFSVRIEASSWAWGTVRFHFQDQRSPKRGTALPALTARSDIRIAQWNKLYKHTPHQALAWPDPGSIPISPLLAGFKEKLDRFPLTILFETFKWILFAVWNQCKVLE